MKDVFRNINDWHIAVYLPVGIGCAVDLIIPLSSLALVVTTN
jgi:hypothetical protein